MAAGLYPIIGDGFAALPRIRGWAIWMTTMPFWSRSAFSLPGFQQPLERGEGLWQFPALQRRGLIEGHDLAFDQRQVPPMS